MGGHVSELKDRTQHGWIGVDLDATLAHYTGWKSEDDIGEPIPAMLERVKRWLAEGKDVRIFTARVENGTHQIEVIERWLLKHLGRLLRITNIKDQMMHELWDDRAIQVIKNTGQRADGITD